MTKVAMAMLLLLGTLTCGPETEPVAKADRPHGSKHGHAYKPSPAARVWQDSNAAEAAGKLEDALSALTQLPAAQRSSYLASYRRGWLLYRLGRYAESVAAYNVAAAMEPASVEARVALLLPLMAQSKWDAVSTAAQEVLKRDPENYLALQRLAYAKFSSQHFPEAESLYRRLVQLYPSDVEMRAALGWAVLRMGKRKESASLFKQVLEVSPNHASATQGLKAAFYRSH